jgi:hypothetical protein
VWLDLALLGVDLVIVGRRASTVEGTTISEGVMASAQGLLDGSSGAALLRVLLSVLLSRILFGSPRTACALANPEELDPELAKSEVTVLEDALAVSMWSPLLGDLPLIDMSSWPSTQPAGVGGTGPKVESRWGGLLVGGDTKWSFVRVILWDLDCGGGPGGGGGNGIPGSHRVVEDPREREDEGVLMAPADAALREAGGRESAIGGWSSSDEGAASIDIGTGRLTAGGGTFSLLASGESRPLSGAVLLVKVEMLNMFGGLSLEPARVREGGGGGKVGFETGSGDALYRLAGETRAAGDMPERTSSLEITDARWFRGGEYGGGAGVTTGTALASPHFDNSRKVMCNEYEYVQRG